MKESEYACQSTHLLLFGRSRGKSCSTHFCLVQNLFSLADGNHFLYVDQIHYLFYVPCEAVGEMSCLFSRVLFLLALPMPLLSSSYLHLLYCLTTCSWGQVALSPQNVCWELSFCAGTHLSTHFWYTHTELTWVSSFYCWLRGCYCCSEKLLK